METNLGVSDDELGKLHAFANDYRAKRAERQQAEVRELGKREDYLVNYKATLESIYDSMSLSEHRVVAREDGGYLVIRKSRDRLRLALTRDKDINLGGYRPDFDEILEWQEVDIDRVNGRTVASRFHHWNKDQLGKARSQLYWASATEVNLTDLDKSGADQFNVIFEKTKKAIQISDVPKI